MNQHTPMPLPGQQPPVQDPDPFAPPPTVDDAGTPPLPRPATDGPGLTPWATTSPAPLAVH